MQINGLFLSFLAGIFLADFLVYTEVVSKTLLYMLFSLFLLALIFWKEKVVRYFALSSFFLLFALFYYQFFIQKPSPSYISYYNGERLILEGKISEEPEKDKEKSKIVLEIPNIKGRVLITAPLYPEYRFGDQLKVKGLLEEPPVFDEFNYKNYLKSLGIYSLMKYPEIEKIGEVKPFFLKKWLFFIKNHFEEALNKILPEPEAALASGLLLGVRRGIPDWLLEALIVVGLIHLIALSGYNITVISKNLQIFFNYFAPRFAFWVSLLCIWLFVIMVGAKATIVRAALMGCLLLLAKKVGRKREMTRILLLTAFLMVLVNPLILKYDSSFQLSFLATTSLIYLAPVFEKWLKNWAIPNSIKEAGVATLSAQFFVLPLLFFNFKKISLIAPLCNILVIPTIPFAMFFIFLSGSLGIFWLGLGQLFGWFAFLFLKYIVLVAQIFSKIPGAYFEVKRVSIFSALIYWLVLGLFIKWVRKRL